MGKWAQPNYDQELVRKFRIIFEELKGKLGNDQDGEPYTFDKFVENFDETDHFTKRICEFLVKEARPRRVLPMRPAPFDRFRRLRVVNNGEERRRLPNMEGAFDETDDDDANLAPMMPYVPFRALADLQMPPVPPLMEHEREELAHRRRHYLLRRPPPAQRPNGEDGNDRAGENVADDPWMPAFRPRLTDRLRRMRQLELDAGNPARLDIAR